MMKRYAVVVGNGVSKEKVSAYLPSNYKVCVEVDGKLGKEVVIEGRDSQGWTLDSYIIPRLGSGLMGCTEIDLSHPVMKQIPV